MIALIKEEAAKGCYRVFLQALGIEADYFYRPVITSAKRELRTAADIERLVALHDCHPYWGDRRLAPCLGWSLNKTRRLKLLAGLRIKPARRAWRPVKDKLAVAPPNLLPTEQEVLAEDFTHLGRFYLAVCMRLSTRQICSFKLATHKGSGLVDPPLAAALDLFEDYEIVHSDRGSEYLAASHRRLITAEGLQQSCSAAGSPWQNGCVERFFRTLKYEFLGDTKTYVDYRQLWEAINISIFAYNEQRYHSSLGTTPNDYALRNAKTPLNLTTIKPVLKKVP